MPSKLTFVLFALFAQAFALPGPRPDPPSVPPGQLKKWKPVGCFTDQAAPNRALGEASYVDHTGMTVDSCIVYCLTNGYNYAGVEYARECYCDYTIRSSGVPSPQSECNMPCTGDSKEICGAGDRLNIYSNGDKEPQTPKSVKTWRYDGCYVDSVQDRTLERPLSISSGVTAQTCTAACKTAGFKYAGLEFGSECFCGNTLDSAKVSDSQCKTVCKADTDQFCGGPDRLTVFVDTSSGPN